MPRLFGPAVPQTLGGSPAPAPAQAPATAFSQRGSGADDGGDTGSIPITPSGTPGVVSREVYTAKNQEVPGLGTLVRSEGQAPASDDVVNKAYDNAGVVYQFYKDVLGRDSLDDKGMVLKSTVHYGKDFNNAYWDGTHMTYGDGDGTEFSNFANDLSVVGHEMTHGVTENTDGLNYNQQPGALNESWSDVMGDFIRQWHDQGADKFATVAGAQSADWFIGDECFTPGKDGDGLRSLAHPGTAYPGDPQPADMAHYKKMWSDNGGVHINSGIPNHAAYEVAQKIGSQDTAKIWYKAMTSYMKPNSQFMDAANDTVRAATDLFGASSPQVQAVKDGWGAVGLSPTMVNSKDEARVIRPKGGSGNDGVVPAWLLNHTSAPTS
jgi:Zn-dependent metalloprotease